MLIKLLKYDFKFGKTPFLGMAGCLIFLAVVARMFETPFLRQMGMNLVLPLLLVVVIVAGLILVYQNFNKNLYGGEGYLMLTLPVKRYKLIVSKIITSMVWFDFMAVAVAFAMSIYFGNEVTLFRGMSVWGLLSFALEIFLINLMVVNFVLILYILATVANVSFRGRRLGWIFSIPATALFFVLEILFGVKVANPLFDGMGLWIVEGETSAGVYITKAIHEVIASMSNTSTFVADFALLSTLVLFSVIAYVIVLVCLKTFVDLQ